MIYIVRGYHFNVKKATNEPSLFLNLFLIIGNINSNFCTFKIERDT